MGEHGFGCVCLDCSGNKIADGAYELNTGLARQRSGLESHDPDPACACPRCDGMRSVAGFPQAAKGSPVSVWNLNGPRKWPDEEWGEVTPAAQALISGGVAENQALRIAAVEKERDALKAALGIVAAEQGNHDWKGPTREEIDLDTGKTVRRAVPDPVAEQVHRVVGDVLAGKVLPAQREQLGDALGNAPKHTKSTASTDAPMPGKALRLARADVGLKLP